HTRSDRDWSSDVCSSDLPKPQIRSAQRVFGRRIGRGQPPLGSPFGVLHFEIQAQSGGTEIRIDDADRNVEMIGHHFRGSRAHPRSEERRVGKEWRAMEYD